MPSILSRFGSRFYGDDLMGVIPPQSLEITDFFRTAIAKKTHTDLTTMWGHKVAHT